MMTDTLTRLERLLAGNQHLQERQIAILQRCEGHLLAASVAAMKIANPSVDELTLAMERLEVLEDTVRSLQEIRR